MKLSASDLQQLVEKCIDVSDNVTDNNGFVPVRDLVAQFGADLVIRPLLVEGMLASGKTMGSNIRQWTVLLDSEIYRVSPKDIENEGISTPLPERMRNTVAHELAHSLAFRSAEFGVKLKKIAESGKSRREFIAQIERETEKLSPLLLLSNKSLDKLFSYDKKIITIQEWRHIQKQMGISRYVLINRLNLLQLSDKHDLLNRPALQNLALGIGEWTDSSKAILKEWPLFKNFRRIMPAFLINLVKKGRSTIDGVFSDPSFCLCGGPSNHIEHTVSAGTDRNPTHHELRIQMSVEPVPRRNGSRFLFFVRTPDSPYY